MLLVTWRDSAFCVTCYWGSLATRAALALMGPERLAFAMARHSRQARPSPVGPKAEHIRQVGLVLQLPYSVLPVCSL